LKCTLATVVLILLVRWSLPAVLKRNIDLLARKGNAFVARERAVAIGV
jgi:hypothetical protein